MKLNSTVLVRAGIFALALLLVGGVILRHHRHHNKSQPDWDTGPQPTAAPAPQPAQVGVNLNELAYYGAFSPRYNLVDQLGGNKGIWDTPDGNNAAKTTADGYPLEPGWALLWQPLQDFGPGVYAIRYSGGGQLLVNGQPVAPDTTQRIELHPAANGGDGSLRLEFGNIDPANPPKSLIILPPGVNVADRMKWNPVFLEKLKPFLCLRMMDWTKTNNSDVVKWSDRPGPDSLSWCNGVPWESIIDLANLTGKDLWINIPAKADDDYVDHLAALFAERLKDPSHVYVEYSNECWNSIFQQEKYIRTVTAANNPELTQPDAYGRAGQQVAFKTRQIGNAFVKAFGQRSAMVRPVLCGQSFSPWALGEGLAFLKEHYGSTAPLYAIGVAPYLTFADGTDNPGMSADDAFASLRTYLDGPCTDAEKEDLKISRTFGLPLIAYEGGNQLTAIDGKNEAVKKAVQSDPRMGQLYADYFKLWQASGGGLFNHYALVSPPNKWGSWGLLDSLQQKSSPKWDAVMNFIASGQAPPPATQPGP